MSFMTLVAPRPEQSLRACSYGWRRALVQIAMAAACSLTVLCGPAAAQTVPAQTAPAPVKIVALGDSLTAGFGLTQPDGFVARLQQVLTAQGVVADIQNAGVSGD